MRFTIAFFLVVACAGFAATSAYGAGDGPNAGFHRVALDSAASFPDPGLTARRQRVVILHAWQKDLARQLKAADPSVRVLVYKNLSFIACDAYAWGTYVPQGVRCPEVEANHSDWFLTDSTGARLVSGGYSWLYVMDVGNPAYQDAWATGVITEARADGWDGVFMDDVNSTLKYHLAPTRVAKYPTDAQWTAATRAMLSTVGPRIQANGLLAVANVCCSREHPIWAEWLNFLSGAMDETFTKWGAGPGEGYIWDWGAGGWATQLEEVRATEAQGKLFLGVSHSAPGDVQAARYGLATMLLASSGRASFSFAPDYTTETWFPDYDRALQLGAPLGSYSRSSAAYRREFLNGTVVVNPSQTSQTVALSRPHIGPNGSQISSLTLAPTTGAILLVSTGSPPPPQPPPPPPPPPPGRRCKKRCSIQLFAGGMAGESATAQVEVRGRVSVAPKQAGVLSLASRRGVRVVRLQRWTGRGWRLVARLRTRRGAAFSVRVRLRGPAYLRAVVRHRGVQARSRVVRISRAGR
jgi:hypothetical protein